MRSAHLSLIDLRARMPSTSSSSSWSACASDSAAIGVCYREHVGSPSKPLKSQIRDLQRVLGREEVPGVPDELARLLAEEKEEVAEGGVPEVKEEWGDVDEQRLGRFLMADLKVTLGFSSGCSAPCSSGSCRRRLFVCLGKYSLL